MTKTLSNQLTINPKGTSLEMPKVAVVVINWNGGKNTYECLRSLQDLHYPNYEVLLVDNASTDESPKIAKQLFPKIIVKKNKKNLGFGGGLNVGVLESKKLNANYVLCLNNDVVVDKNILSSLVKVGETDGKIAGLCPIEYFYSDSKRINSAGGIIRFFGSKTFGNGELDNGQFNTMCETQMLCGPAMMLKVNAALDVGLFAENFFYGPEDIDMALRLREKGYRLIFVPSAKLWHKTRGSTGGKITPVTVYFDVRNHLLFVRKHAKKIDYFFSILYFGITAFSFVLFRSLIRKEKRNMTAAINGVVSGINGDLLPSDPQIAKMITGT